MAVMSFNKIDEPNGWLSNMSAYKVRWNAQVCPTAEHLFQCMRFQDDPSVQAEILNEPSPMIAKHIAKGHRAKLEPDLRPKYAEDIENMRLVVRLKVAQNSELIRMLVGSSDLIVEDSTRRQSDSGLFWGASLQNDGSWKGQNNLGKIWMELRYELQKALWLKPLVFPGSFVKGVWAEG